MSQIPKEDWENFKPKTDELLLSNAYSFFLANNYSKLQQLIKTYDKNTVYNLIRQELLDKNELVHSRYYQNIDNVDENIENMFVDIFAEELSINDLLHTIDHPNLQNKIINILKEKKLNINEELKKISQQDININWGNPQERDLMRIEILLNFSPLRSALKGEKEEKIIKILENRFNLFFPDETNILFSNAYLYMIEFYRKKIQPNENILFKNYNFFNFQLKKRILINDTFYLNKKDLITVLSWMEKDGNKIELEIQKAIIDSINKNKERMHQNIWLINEEPKLNEIFQRFSALEEKILIESNIININENGEVKKI